MSVATQSHAVEISTAGRTLREPAGDRLSVPVLETPRGSVADRFVAAALPERHPVIVFLAVVFTGLALVATLSIGLGLLVTHLLLPSWGIGAADERFPAWLAANRSDALGDASVIGSIMSGGVTLPIIAVSLVLTFAVLRRWRLAAFTIFALALESASYRITTLVVPRERPEVVRLEDLPANASYPSGHTAASIAVYAGLALLLTSRIENGAFRALAWTIAVAVPVFVALSRMYRGMHHPLDVAGGAVIGIAAVMVVVLACRAAGAAAEARSR